jgi:hypothetical protein
MLGMPVMQQQGKLDLGPGALAARVRISGLWDLSLVLRCQREVAMRWAAAMFNRNTAETTNEDLRDAMGELANMVAGNLKGLLPGEFRLGLPVVAEWYMPEGPRTGYVVADAHLMCDQDPLHVFLMTITPTAGQQH